MNKPLFILLLPNKQLYYVTICTIFKKCNYISRRRNQFYPCQLGSEHGEFLYIIGKTGSGKSSLMKTLYADLPLTEGEGNIVDFDLANFKRR